MNRAHLLSIVATLALAACGGKSTSSSATTTTPTTDETPTESTTVEAPPPDAEPPPDPREGLLAAESAALDAARPVFDQYCGNCHLQGGVKATAKTLAKLDVSDVPFTGEDASPASIGHVLGLDGSKPTMPKNKPGSVSADNLALVKAWVDAYDAAEAGGAHDE